MSASTWDTCPQCRSPHALREDADIGIATCGMFFVTYRGECAECGFGFVYRHEEKVPVGVAADVVARANGVTVTSTEVR